MAKRKCNSWFDFERRMIRSGYRLIAGVDEAGRGPLAGPVVASAVILPTDRIIEGIADSKRLSAKRRKELFSQIMANSIVGIGAVSEAAIDDTNILRAALKAMEKAILNLPVSPDRILIDGQVGPNVPYPTTQIVKGDERCLSIAAASIVAKVIRDRMMAIYHKFYPRYGFSQHKGYPTSTHLTKIDRYGPSPIHRYTFRPVRERKEVLS